MGIGNRLERRLQGLSCPRRRLERGDGRTQDRRRIWCGDGLGPRVGVDGRRGEEQEVDDARRVGEGDAAGLDDRGHAEERGLVEAVDGKGSVDGEQPWPAGLEELGG